MLRSLYIAATGMEAQKLNIDVISNNLANVNTTGFKKSRADFQDLLYQTIRLPGATSAEGSQIPSGIQVGMGVKPVAVQKIFQQGDFVQTGNSLDMVIQGDGFFQILMPDGTTSYTRAGAFKLDSEGRIVAAVTFNHGRWLSHYRRLIERAAPLPGAFDDALAGKPVPARFPHPAAPSYHGPTVVVTGHTPTQMDALRTPAERTAP